MNFLARIRDKIETSSGIKSFFSDEEREDIIYQYRDCEISVSEIAEEYSVKPEKIRIVLRNAGVLRDSKEKREISADLIRDMRDKGKNLEEISKFAGVSITTIHNRLNENPLDYSVRKDLVEKCRQLPSDLIERERALSVMLYRHMGHFSEISVRIISKETGVCHKDILHALERVSKHIGKKLQMERRRAMIANHEHGTSIASGREKPVR